MEHQLCAESGSAWTRRMVDSVVLRAEVLICHHYARHVLELVLEHGDHSQKATLVRAIARNALEYVGWNGHYLVEKALGCCGGVLLDEIAGALTRDPARFVEMAAHGCGCHVAEAVVKSRAACAERAKELLLDASERVRSTRHGRRLLAHIQNTS